ncbi:mechanosensitive ion channel [bacterium]|nr:mechanosensitive ion channel [bacterium]
MSIITKIQEFLGPVASSALGHALIGLLILLVGLFVVKILANLFNSIFIKSDFLKNKNLVKPIVSLVKSVMTVFILMAVLQHFGLTSVLEPLENLVNQFLQAIPKVIGAGVVAYSGWVIAKIVSELVALTLQKFDTKLVEKTGNSKIKVAKFGSTFVFVAILLPISVAALGVLDIPAITLPASQMINELLTTIPNIIGAAMILLVTYLATKFIIYILSGLLESMNIAILPEKLGLQSLFKGSLTPTKLICNVIMFFAMVTASIAAVEALGIDMISGVFLRVLDFGGGILIGSVILIIGNFLGSIAYKKLSTNGNLVIASIARAAILGLVLAMGLRSMGLAENIVNMAFGFTIGAIAVAFALAFGVGGKDAAKKVADKMVGKL